MRARLLLSLLAVQLPSLGLGDDALRRSSVFVEGEDFEPVGEGWSAGEGWNDDIYEATSGDAVLCNTGDRGEARRQVTVPAGGTCNVWVRYLRIGTYPGTFGLRVEQGGNVVFDGVYRTRPEGDDWRPMWEKLEAHLPAGPATLTLYVATPGIRQRVDCVLMTPDLGYEPDYHDFARQVFVRFRLVDPPESVVARVTNYMHRAPTWYGDPGTISASGLAPGGGPVPPGEWSPWCDVSKHMDAGKRLTTVKLRFLAGDQPLRRVHVDLQVAAEPDRAAAVAFHEELEGEIVGLSLPGDVARYGELCVSVSDLAARHLESVKALGLPPLAATEATIPLELGIWGWGDSYRSTEVLRREMEAARLLGANVLNDLIGVRRELAARLGVQRSFLSQWLPYQAWRCPTDPQLPAMMDEHFAKVAQDIRGEDPAALDRCVRNILWDEPGTSDLGHLGNCPTCLAAFHAYLRQQGLAPADFGKAAWEETTPIARDLATDAPLRRLHYWSVQFRDLTNACLVREASLASQQHLGSGILTCVNFTDGAISGWDAALSNGPDWFLYGRLQATSLLWSEDWASLGPEVSGLITDLLRAAARPSKLPIGEYIICNHAPTLEQRAFSALMHGARMLHFYCYGPYFAFADGMVSDSPEVQKALGLTLRKIAAADPYLCPAALPQAQVAILWGKSHEIWQSDAAVGTERRSVYVALQHAHVPVDLVSEQDLAEGALGGCKLLYVLESNVRRDAAARIVEWVHGGGVLQMCAGAGARDEYNEPLADLTELCGVTVQSVEKPTGDYREHYGLSYTAARGEVSLPEADLWQACTLPLMGYSETAEPVAAQVLARFGDGLPAVFRRTVGKGAVLRFAFMPGLGYVKAADPGPNRLTVGYRSEHRAIVTAGLKLAGIEPRLALSEPLVEAQLLEGPQADVLAMANWCGRDIPSLKVTIDNGRRYASAESVSSGPLGLTPQGDGLVLTLPLGATDVVVLRR